MEIKAIETIYNGRRYRSRLEARWAVFFDSLGIRFEDEPEGFVLSNGMAYLPDFFLPDIGGGIFAEVKGGMSDTCSGRTLNTPKSSVASILRPSMMCFTTQKRPATSKDYKVA